MERKKKMNRMISDIKHSIKRKKKFWKSKTFWFNIVSALVFFGSEISGANLIDPKLLIALIAGGNTILRFLTDSKVGIK